jgi:hypothetical protein
MSLLNADYLGHFVLLDISIDAVDTSYTEQQHIEHQQIINYVHTFHWPYGTLNVIIHAQKIGLMGQWTTGWTYEKNTLQEILFFMEDDIIVTPIFYTWLYNAINKYYLTSSEYDPLLYGISLQNQHAIIGESLKHRYGSRHIHRIVGKHLFYRYQLIGTR